MRTHETEDSAPEWLRPFTTQYEQSLVVVTTGDGDEPAGCLVGFATQCSIKPPRFIVCISKANYTFTAIERADHAAIHLLRRDQSGLGSLFGEETSDSVAKFAQCSWHLGVTGVPVLDDCAAWIEGRILQRFAPGDHEVVVVQPCDGGGGAPSKVLTLRHSPEFRAGHPR